jgi:molybdate transport system regulatory protein
MAKKREKLIVNVPEIRFKIRIGNGAVGPGKISLLQAIESTGSISSAARQCGMNYRRAQYLLETLTEATGSAVVTTVVGGATGGGAQLTATGQALVRTYSKLDQSLKLSAKPELKTLGDLIDRAQPDH